ncbi:MAG TPA: NAD-dependent epimerase/dehydratase family protein [Terriglobales bacterium]|jgi:nucleoside-diphosphate-sugar epimerase|nr:NAD-dependent epimerase/dehydratase family protein [Terriglobales bacterium]
MRVCVTGGTGFLGGFLVRDLLAKGTDVVVLARRSSRADALGAAGVQIVAGDLADSNAISHAVRDADVVYHLAAKVGTAKHQEYFETNVAGTERVMTACAEQGVGQFVYASSLAVYGPIKGGERIDESTPFDEHPELRDPYAQSKIAADRLVSSFANKTGLPTVILREGIIFGPGRALPNGIFAFQLGKTNIVFGEPQNKFPLNYVENIVDAMQVAAASGTGLREYNVLDDDELTLGRYHELKSAIDHSKTRFSSPWPLYAASPITEVLRPIVPMGDLRLSRHQLERALQDRWYDTRRIREAAGWKPRVALGEALKRTADAVPGKVEG